MNITIMIPLYKLEKLTRTQKLRKIAKYFTFAENRLCMANNTKSEGVIKNAEPFFVSEPLNASKPFSEGELVFFADAAKLLAEDSFFEQDAIKVFKEAFDVFNAVISSNDTGGNQTATLRRALNCIRHILLTETGKEPADWDFTARDGRLDPEKRQIFEGMRIYLEDIRSPFNVGAMFRTAESFGVEKIILSPFCADPRHRRAERTAMGCIDIVPWERRGLFASVFDNRAAIAPNNRLNVGTEEPPDIDVPVFALETGGVPLDEFSFPQRGILIAGSEELGVSPCALAAADASLGRVSILCYGAKASLNVSVAFGIALQKWAAFLRGNSAAI